MKDYTNVVRLMLLIVTIGGAFSSCMDESDPSANPAMLLGRATENVPIENQMDLAMQFNLEMLDRVGFFWFQNDAFPRPRAFSAMAIIPESIFSGVADVRVPLLAWVDGSSGVLYWMPTPDHLNFFRSEAMLGVTDMAIQPDGRLILLRSSNWINQCLVFEGKDSVVAVPGCADIDLGRPVQGLEPLGNSVLAFGFDGYIGKLTKAGMTPWIDLGSAGSVIALRASANGKELAVLYNEGKSLMLISDKGETLWNKPEILIPNSNKELQVGQMQDIAPLSSGYWVGIAESHRSYVMLDPSGELVQDYPIHSLPKPFYTPRGLYSIRSVPDRGFLFVREKQAITGYSQFFTLNREEMYDYLPDEFEPVLFAIAQGTGYTPETDVFEVEMPAFLINQAKSNLD